MGDLNYRITQLDAQGMVERTALAARHATSILRHSGGKFVCACVCVCMVSGGTAPSATLRLVVRSLHICISLCIH